MKKIISILILSIFIYNTFGFLAAHSLLSIYYKYLGIQEANKPSKKEMIELLIFNKEDIKNRRIDFRWIHSREFKYNNDMYDIVKKEETDKELKVYCINDTKERMLEKEFEKRVHKNSSEDKNRPIVKNYNFNSISEPVQTAEINLSFTCNNNIYCLGTADYKSLIPDIPSPPPRFT